MPHRFQFFPTLFALTLTRPVWHAGLLLPLHIANRRPGCHVRKNFTKIAPQNLPVVNCAECCCGMASERSYFRDLKVCHP